MNLPIILASKSPRRKNLLEQAGIRFRVKVPKKEELPAPKTLKKWSPQKIVKQISQAKALACAEEWIQERQGDAIIVSADTLVFIHGKVLSKPNNRAEAKKMLSQMQGKWHWVYSGVTLLKLEKNKIRKKINFHVATKVKFFPLNKEMIDWYVKTKEPMDKAGAYGAQGYGAILIEKFSGSYTNVVGLPLGQTLQALDKMQGKRFFHV